MRDKNAYFATVTRGMLREAKIIGRVPFILFQYYLTYLTAPDGIRPTLKTISEDLGMDKSAICNARAILENHDWIKYENERVLITKSFISDERDTTDLSFKMNDLSSDMNERSFNMNGTELAFKGFINKEYKEKEKEEKKQSGGGSSSNGGTTAGKSEIDVLNSSEIPDSSNQVQTAAAAVSKSFSNKEEVPKVNHNSENGLHFETLPDYLTRKQLEYPHFNVREIHADFVAKITSGLYPKLRNTQRAFDKWLADQEIDLGSLSPPDIINTAKTRAERIKNCPKCDDYGYIKIGDAVKICKHEIN